MNIEIAKEILDRYDFTNPLVACYYDNEVVVVDTIRKSLQSADEDDEELAMAIDCMPPDDLRTYLTDKYYVNFSEWTILNMNIDPFHTNDESIKKVV